MVAADRFNLTDYPQLVKKDSNGMVLCVEKKYGDCIIDSGTILLESKDEYIIVKKIGISSRYERCNTWRIYELK